ncbi:phosphoribosyltransferase-like protein [Hoeflea olei]|uniref:PRTase-CE domain-containing protein n=1 Tax=Hoeflea olei TaxID=1480615 RepID=A0A1C1YRC0_9HYPH|nr:hypothetical protein [Hoeflea olei]OCW56111.1 hypothetical protein AWJ14_12965 [Hoeflea olei]
MVTRNERLDAVVEKISDYREGEIAPMNAAHVDRWVQQFPEGVQEPLLAELAHVFDKTYFTRKKVNQFLSAVAVNERLTAGNPAEFWKKTTVLDIQTSGNSQHEMLATFDTVLQKACGISLSECGQAGGSSYVYIDDVLFSGGRIKNDIVRWIKDAAPQNAKLVIITIAYHRLGQWRTENDILEAAKAAGKKIELSWPHVFKVEDRKKYIDNSDVLRPTAIPADRATAEYVAGLTMDPVFRTPGQLGDLGFFSTEAGRSLLEQQFLVSGVQVRGLCRHLNTYMRPLGNSMMGTTGFGSMIATYRNCPNNAPLVLWAGDPWYPLFPRKTN